MDDNEWRSSVGTRTWAVASSVDKDSQAGRANALKMTAQELLAEAANMRSKGGPGHYTLLFMALELSLKSTIVCNDLQYEKLNANATDKLLKDFSHNIKRLYKRSVDLGMASFENGERFAEWVDDYYLSANLRYKYTRGGQLPAERHIIAFAKHVIDHLPDFLTLSASAARP